jgi:hypothetical protein
MGWRMESEGWRCRRSARANNEFAGSVVNGNVAQTDQVRFTAGGKGKDEVVTLAETSKRRHVQCIHFYSRSFCHEASTFFPSCVFSLPLSWSLCNSGFSGCFGS